MSFRVLQHTTLISMNFPKNQIATNEELLKMVWEHSHLHLFKENMKLQKYEDLT